MSEPIKISEPEPPQSPKGVPAEEAISIDISHIQTEDDAPVDSLFAERQGRLLVESLYASWKPSEPFLACENVGVFYGLHLPPIVPDVFVSLGVSPPQGRLVHEKHRRSYFLWEYGKPPDLVVEILSPTYGGEFDEKMKRYAQIGVAYYVVYDPALFHAKEVLSCYELHGRQYAMLPSGKLSGIGLEVRLWAGQYEAIEAEWLRWYDLDGELLLTGMEQVERARQVVEAERQRAEDAERRADRLAAELRKLGLNPDTL